MWKKNGLKKCKKNAEKYAKEMHKNARTKMSKEKFKKGKKMSKTNMSKDETKTSMVGLWNNGSALVLKLEGHGFKSLFRAFVFSS